MHQGRIVEQGLAAEVLRAPKDPYTQRLVAAAPVADPVLQHRRREAWRQLVDTTILIDLPQVPSFQDFLLHDTPGQWRP
jgi:ABC-type dipeptide/oligopeptide/nickel transport system ATPase component